MGRANIFSPIVHSNAVRSLQQRGKRWRQPTFAIDKDTEWRTDADADGGGDLRARKRTRTAHVACRMQPSRVRNVHRRRTRRARS